MNTLKSLFKNKWFLGLLLLILIGGGYYYYYQHNKTGAGKTQYITSQVANGSIITSVSGTGQVEASDEIDIKPQSDGRLTKVAVKKNQQVKAGDVIAIVDQQSAANSVAQAKASVEQAEASYKKLLAGATNNDIATSKLSLQSASSSLEQAKQDYDNTVEEQQASVDKALQSLLNSGLEAIPSDTLSTAEITVSGNYTGTQQGSYVISTYQTGGGLSYSVSGLGTNSGTINRGLDQPIGNGLYINFSSSGTINSTTWTINVPNTRASGYLNNLDSYNSAVRDQKQAVQKAQDTITSAQNSLDKAQLSYNQTIEPATQTDIDSSAAQVTSAKAQLANAQTAYDATILTAPFDGVVATLDFSAGDKVTAGTAVATLITEQQIAKITLNELDAAKVKVGQKAVVTFSAVPGLTLTGKVADVDNIGTVSQNVVNFTVKIALDEPNDQIKPGMSVTAKITVSSAENVLVVPSSAVQTDGSGKSYVQTLVNGQPQRVNVTTGVSNDTQKEITGGLKAGDVIIIQTISASAAKPASNSSGSILGGIGGGRPPSGGSSGGGATPSGGGGPPQ
jgi:HlyD family secretion protein